MSPREKKLLTLFAIAGLVMANFVGLSFYNKKSAQMDKRLLDANRVLKELELFEASREQRIDEMEWLQNHFPEPAEYENVQTALKAFCGREASRFGLALTELPSSSRRNSEAPKGTHFQRVKAQYKVTGMEDKLYDWLDRIHVPVQLRGVTSINLSPNKEDDTRIDCTVTVEQWYVPASPSA